MFNDRNHDGWQKWGLSEEHIKEGTQVYVPSLGPGKVRKTPLGDKLYQIGFPDGSQRDISARDFTPLASPTMKLEFLSRKADDERRMVSPASATFNLVSTIVGGGILSLPYAISQCGIALGLMSLALSAYLSNESIDLLVFSVRQRGMETYEDLAFKAWGAVATNLTVCLLTVLTFLCGVAYCVLIGDLSSGIVGLLITMRPLYRKLLILSAISLVSPWCYKESLHSLRYLSTFSVIAICFIALVLTVRTSQSFGEEHKIYTLQNGVRQELLVDWNVNLWPTNWEKALYVFPVFGVAFLCHFNVLPIHTELKKPTKRRIRQVMNGTIVICAILYTIVGCAGYFWSFQNTCGDILLNFPENDYLVTAARCSLILVLMGSYPLLVLPCRSTLHRLLVVISDNFTCFSWYNKSKHEMEQPLLKPHDKASDNGEGLFTDTFQSKLAQIYPAEAEYYSNEQEPNFNEHYVPTVPTLDKSLNSKNGLLLVTPKDETVQVFISPERVIERQTPSKKVVHVYSRERGKHGKSKLQIYDTYVDLKPRSNASSNEPSRVQRFCLTTFLLASNLAIGLLLDAIMIVWTILGATISFTIAFTLPSLFFLKLNWNRSSSEVSVRRKVVAVGMLGTSIIFSIVCTVMVVLNLAVSPCPPIGS